MGSSRRTLATQQTVVGHAIEDEELSANHHCPFGEDDGYWAAPSDSQGRSGCLACGGRVPFLDLLGEQHHVPLRGVVMKIFVFVLDIIEHIQDDTAFLNAIIDVFAEGGKIWLSTPSNRLDLRYSPHS